MANKIISCDIHDHFEIACMRRSRITIELHSGQSLSGVAIDLQTKDKNEFLHLKIDDEKESIEINLLDIKTLNFDADDTIIEVSSNTCVIK